MFTVLKFGWLYRHWVSDEGGRGAGSNIKSKFVHHKLIGRHSISSSNDTGFSRSDKTRRRSLKKGFESVEIQFETEINPLGNRSRGKTTFFK